MLVYDTPATAIVMTPTSVDAGIALIRNVTIRSELDGRVTIDVGWSLGYLDDKNEFQRVRDAVAHLEGDDVLLALAAPVTDGKSQSENFEQALWAFMKMRGIVPEGKVM